MQLNNHTACDQSQLSEKHIDIQLNRSKIKSSSSNRPFVVNACNSAFS